MSEIRALRADRDYWFNRYEAVQAKLEAAEAREREAKELLKEARWSVEHCRLLELLARIDAALAKDAGRT